MVTRYPDPGPSSDATSPGFKAASADTLRSFQEAAEEYLGALTRVGARLQEGHQEGLVSLLDTSHYVSQQATHGEAAATAYRDLLGALWSSDAAKIRTAQQAYVESLQALRTEAENVTKSALGDYQSKVNSSWESVRAELSAAFHEYIAKVKSVISNLRDEDIDPPTLALIAQSLAMVAAYADHTTKFAEAVSPRPQF
jgi:hypothetical protein